jgi:hypothetical protein
LVGGTGTAIALRAGVVPFPVFGALSMATVQLSKKEVEMPKETAAVVVAAPTAPHAQDTPVFWGDRVMMWVWGASLFALAVLTLAEIVIRQFHLLGRFWN